MTCETETYYGNENETYYVDQFGRIWLVQSVDFSEARDAELQSELPSGLIEVNGGDLELSDNVFELTEVAEEEVTKQAKEDAEIFVDEWNEDLNPTQTDWDAEGFQNCQFSFHTQDQKTYDQAWNLYQSALAAETKRLCK